MVSEPIVLLEQGLACKPQPKLRECRWQAGLDTSTGGFLWEVRPEEVIVPFEAYLSLYSPVGINQMFKVKAQGVN